MIGIKICTFPNGYKINFQNKYIPDLSGVVYTSNVYIYRYTAITTVHHWYILLIIVFNQVFNLLEQTSPAAFLLCILVSFFTIGNFCKIPLCYGEMCFTVLLF